MGTCNLDPVDWCVLHGRPLVSERVAVFLVLSPFKLSTSHKILHVHLSSESACIVLFFEVLYTSEMHLLHRF